MPNGYVPNNRGQEINELFARHKRLHTHVKSHVFELIPQFRAFRVHFAFSFEHIPQGANAISSILAAKFKTASDHILFGMESSRVKKISAGPRIFKGWPNILIVKELIRGHVTHARIMVSAKSVDVMPEADNSFIC